MTLKLAFAALQGNFEKSFKEHTDILERASMAGAKQVGESLKRDARKVISNAGFSTRWQNAYRVKVYPERGKKSMNPAIFAYHKIDYSGVFEEGGSWTGKMWIPTDNAPPRTGRQKITPRLFNLRFGKLQFIRKGQVEMLISTYRRGRGRPRKGEPKTRVIFIRINRVTISRKWFSIQNAIDRASSALPGAIQNSVEA